MGLFDRFFGPPSQDQFAKALMTAIRAAGETAELSYEPAASRIVRTRDGEPAGEINLGNMYRTYAELPKKKRAEYLKVCVRGALATHRELPDDFDSARHDLRPRLFARCSIEAIRLRAEKEKKTPDALNLVTEPVGEHILSVLSYDWPEAVQTIHANQLDTWGVSAYEALEAAKMNLAEVPFGIAEMGENLRVFMTGDSYDATRILLTDHIRNLELQGRPVAMAPNRDMLLVTGSDDEVGLAMMVALGSEALEKQYPLSGIPLILEDDGWADWMPPEGHSCRDAFQKLRSSFLGPRYAEQKSLLEEFYADDPDAPFVASFSGVTKGEDDVVTYCVWGDGVDALLPVSQKVVFFSQNPEGAGQQDALGTWERVQEVVGHLMEPTDHYPPRYRVRDYPDAEDLAAIGKAEMLD